MIPLEIQFREPQRIQVGDPQAVAVHDDVERQGEAGKCLDELDLRRVRCRLEHVDAAARAIQREYPSLRTDGHGMNAIELAGSAAMTAELCDVVGIPIEDQDAVIVQPVGDENPTVGQKCHVLGLGKMRPSLPGTFFSPSVLMSFLPSFENT